MKKKPNKSVSVLNALHLNFIKLEILKILKQRAALHQNPDVETSSTVSYQKLNTLQSFHSKVQQYCFFTGRARGNYLNYITRYKLREYQGHAFLVGLRKSH